jgi:hypothetical protein
MKIWKGWLALAGVLYLFFLVWMIPAGMCWAWWAGRPGSGAERVTMVDLHGPWSSGSCGLVKIGPLRFERLTWTIRPLALLRGRLEFTLATGLPDAGKATAILSLGRQDLELRDLQLQGSAAPFGRELLPGIVLTGALEGKNLRLRLAKGLPVAAEGELLWRGAGLELTGPVSLGDLALQLQSGEAGINAMLKDRSGPLRLELQTRLKPDGSYEVTGEVVPRGALQPELGNLLALLGPPAPDGRVRLNRTGRLNPLY